MKNHSIKRKHDRVDTLLEATFSDGQKMFVDNILNLSMGGACLECQRPIEKGKGVTLVIPASPAVKVSGVTRWCTKNGLKYRIGLEFGELLPDQKRALGEFMGTSFWDTIR